MRVCATDCSIFNPSQSFKVRFCLGSSFVLEVDVDSDPDQCMILVYADGKYIYEPAEFVKIKDVYYFDAPHYLEKRGISMPPLMSWFPSKSNFIGVVRWLMPSKNGFVLQTANVCEMRFDCEKLSLCHGSIQKIIWRANTEKQTIKGRAAVRHSADALLSLQGEIGAEKLQSCFNDLVESFYPKMGGFIGEGIRDCFELPGLYIKTAEKTYRGWLERKSASQILEEFLGDHPECAMMKNDDGTEKDVATESEPDDLANMIADFNEQEREAYERLRLLEAQGLSSVPAQNFAKNKTLSISKGYGAGNLKPLQEDGCIRKIRAFEKTLQAVVYLCIMSKSVFGRLLTVFYVSSQPDEWQTDRQWLSEKNPVVYVINLDDEDIADIGGIRYRISRGGIVRVE